MYPKVIQSEYSIYILDPVLYRIKENYFIRQLFKINRSGLSVLVCNDSHITATKGNLLKKKRQAISL